MSYIDKHLIDGETVVYTTRLHWIVLFAPVVAGALFGAAGIALLAYYSNGDGARAGMATPMMAVGGILLFVAAFFILRGILRRNATEMSVTNKRIVVKVGFAARRTVEMLLSRVESIGVEESVTGRVLGYGTVIVRGMGGTPESFYTIAHPLDFRTQVQQQIEKTK